MDTILYAFDVVALPFLVWLAVMMIFGLRYFRLAQRRRGRDRESR